MSYLNAIILGIIQGVAEFLPISSSGHLSIFQNFFGLTSAEGDHIFFDVLLHFGTLIAVFFFYRQDIMDLILEFIAMLKKEKSPIGKEAGIANRRLILMIVIGTLPLLLVLPIKDRLDALYSNTIFIGCALLLTGLILFLSDRVNHGKKTAREATVFDALLVGISQGIATVPGISRSGSTIVTGLCCGFSRSFAVKFSFFLSIPAILGANLLELVDAISTGIEWSMFPKYVVGVLAAMAVTFNDLKMLLFITNEEILHISFGLGSFFRFDFFADFFYFFFQEHITKQIICRILN